MTERTEALIDSLRTARQDVAERNAQLAESDIARRTLKAEIVRELTGKGVAATPAEKVAAQDERLLKYDRQIIGDTLTRDERLGDAEALRFRVQLSLLEMEAAIRDPVRAAA